MKKKPLFVRVITTSRCNMNCMHCNQGAWKDDAYDLKSEELSSFLNACDQSSYTVDCISFGSREPTLHPYIVDLIRLAKGNNTPAIQLVTNGCHIERLEPVKNLINYVRLTHYVGINDEAVKKARAIFRRKVSIVKMRSHYVLPREPIAINKRIACMCKGICFFKNNVYSCVPVINLCRMHPFVEQQDTVATRVSPFFLDNLPARFKGSAFCHFCTDNKNVRKRLAVKMFHE